MELETPSPFNQEFCTTLEYRLGQAFEKSNQQDLTEFWCDGISFQPTPLTQLSKKSINDSRRIVTDAWLGKDGQDIYKMTIRFGQHALRRYAKGSALIDCIPEGSLENWIIIDVDQKVIEIRLR